MLTEEIAVEMVAAGGKWLDAHQPSNWYDLVSLDRLRMSSSTDCVLGQLYEDNPWGVSGYWYVMEAVVDDMSLICSLGFAHIPREDGPGYFEGYGLLDAAWKDYIVRRRIGDLGEAGVHSVELAGV